MASKACSGLGDLRKYVEVKGHPKAYSAEISTGINKPESFGELNATIGGFVQQGARADAHYAALRLHRTASTLEEVGVESGRFR